MTATRTERGLALLVGGGLAVIFVLWGALHVAGWTLGSATRTDHRVVHTPVSALRIEGHGAGDIVVEAGSGPDATVDSVARGAFRAPRLDVAVNGSSVSIRAGCGPVLFDRCSASVTVRVPPGTAVQVSSDSGDLNASGLSGPVRLTTASGDISASELSGTAQLHASSGDVDVHGLSGSAYLRTDSGDVAADDMGSGTVQARTGSGDIDLLFGAAPRSADAETGSGDVNLLVPRSGRYAVDAETSSGDRVVGIATDRQAGRLLRARTGSGDITILPGA